MNKKGELPSILLNNAIFVILVGLFTVFIFGMLIHYKNGAAVWEEFYAKEIVRAVNLAKPGDYITIDLHQASKIAKANGYEDYKRMVRFDNKEKKVTVKLRGTGETSFSFFNDVIIVGDEIELGVPVNVLHFYVRDLP